MTDERPNWVNERARCTLEAKFEELIEAVRFDVEEVKKAVSSVRHGQLFSIESDEKGCVRVRRYPDKRPDDSSGNVTFALSRRKITVHLPGEISFEIVPRWNEAQVQCDLLVDGEPLELWRISQKALGNFFFEDK